MEKTKTKKTTTKKTKPKKNKDNFKEIFSNGWIFYCDKKYKHTNEPLNGKWMYFLKEDQTQDFANNLCKEIINSKTTSICKVTDLEKKNPIFKSHGVIIIYNVLTDIEKHKKILKFMLKNNLIPIRKDNSLFDIQFKLDIQTKHSEYAEFGNFKPILKLSDLMDLKTHKFLDNYNIKMKILKAKTETIIKYNIYGV